MPAGAAIRNTGESAVLTIEDGTFEKATCAVYNEGTVTIEDGTFTGTTCSQCNGMFGDIRSRMELPIPK